LGERWRSPTSAKSGQSHSTRLAALGLRSGQVVAHPAGDLRRSYTDLVPVVPEDNSERIGGARFLSFYVAVREEEGQPAGG
jgi:hypothetical protein